MKIQDIIFAIGLIIAIMLALWYIFGDSPTIEQLLVGLMFTNLTFSFKIYGDLQRHLGEHKGKQEPKEEIEEIREKTKKVGKEETISQSSLP